MTRAALLLAGCAIADRHMVTRYDVEPDRVIMTARYAVGANYDDATYRDWLGDFMADNPELCPDGYDISRRDLIGQPRGSADERTQLQLGHPDPARSVHLADHPLQIANSAARSAEARVRR